MLVMRRAESEVRLVVLFGIRFFSGEGIGNGDFFAHRVGSYGASLPSGGKKYGDATMANDFFFLAHYIEHCLAEGMASF